MSLTQDILKGIQKLEAEAAQREKVIESLKSGLITVAKVLNGVLTASDRGLTYTGSATPTTHAGNGEAKPHVTRVRRARTRGRHMYWHKRPSGQFIYEDGVKACSNCGVKKPATPDYFHKNKWAITKLQSWCKICTDNPIEVARRRRVPDVNVPGKAVTRPRVIRKHSVEA